MEFEFDPAKSRVDRAKHGDDFVTAQKLWDDPDRLEVPARTQDEPRLALLARYEGKVWVALFTYRGERVRVISVRRARDKEVRLYYESD